MNILIGIGTSPVLGSLRPPAPPSLPSAPTFTTQPTISAAFPVRGDVVTVTLGAATGTPSPTVVGVLTLGGVDVTGQMVGLSYTVPADRAGQSLLWTVTAANDGGSVQAAASATVAPFLTATFTPEGQLDIDMDVPPGATHVLFEMTDPPAYAGLHNVELAQLSLGPVNLVPPSFTVLP